MHRARKWGFAISLATLSLLLTATPALTGQGKAKGRHEGPPGWEKGEKKGWKGDLPPGIEKKGGWMPPGLSKEEHAEWKEGKPPGWSRGKKEGWKGSDVPPGWEKWSDEKQRGWEKKLEEAKSRLKGSGKKLKDFSEEDLHSALLSLEAAARKGVPIEHARDLIEKAMERRIRGQDLETASRAMAYGVGKEVDFEPLGKFVNQKLDAGLRGDELSIAIYKEIARRHEERIKAKEMVPKEKER
jgi:hypothetical protein